MNRLLLVIAVLCAMSPSAMTATNAVLTTTAELRALSEPDARKHLRFDLSAQILHKVTGITGCSFTVIDATGGIRMMAEDNPKSFTYTPGDVVRWRGFTDIDSDREFCARCDATDLVGKRPLPPVVQADPGLISSHRYNYMRISVKGRIVTAFRDEIDPDNQYLVLDADGNSVYAATQEIAPPYTNLSVLVDAEVELTGVCVPMQGGRRIFLGPRLQISLPDGIRVIRQPPADPFSAPQIGDIHHVRASDVSAIGRRRVDGTVLAAWGGNRMMVRTEFGNVVRVEISEGALPSCGSRIAVVGLPATDLFHINLSQAIWKQLPGDAPSTNEAPEHVSARDLLFDERGERKFKPLQQGRLFQLEGNVRSLPPRNDPAARMLLSCDGDIIPVDASACPAALDDLELDCCVSVTGVCVFDVPDWSPRVVFPRIEGLALVLRRPEDVDILSSPPWWTPARLLIVIGSLVAVLVGILIWNRALNRIVERRSRQLAMERLAHDGARLRIGERTRLAVEIHDALSQTLTGVSFQIDAAEQARQKDPSQIKKFLDVARQTLLSCRKDLRNCLWDLRNNTLEDTNAARAIRRTVEPHIGEASLSVDFEVPRRRLTDNIFHTVLCIVRELAVNGVRHGAARHIDVRGRLESDVLSISVADDGRGFDPDRHPGVTEGHFGLQGVRERIDALHGTLSVDSAPGKGTRVDIRLKIEN